VNNGSAVCEPRAGAILPFSLDNGKINFTGTVESGAGNAALAIRPKTLQRA